MFVTILFAGGSVGINLFLDTERYDSIISKTFTWSMFLLWSSRNENITSNHTDAEINVAESSELLESDFQICQAMEETFSLIAADDDIPELPELPKAA